MEEIEKIAKGAKIKRIIKKYGYFALMLMPYLVCLCRLSVQAYSGYHM